MSVPTPASLKKQLDQKKSESSAKAASSAPASTKTASERSSSPKKPFVRPEHLTQRPFKDNEALRKLATPAKKSTTKERATAANKRKQDRDYLIKQVKRRKDSGMSNVAIGKELGLAESTIRGLLKPTVKNTNKENN